MSFIRLIKRTVKISIKAKIFINAFLIIGANNLIIPIVNPINAIAKSTVAKIVSVVILFNFLIVHTSVFHYLLMYLR